MSKTLIVQSFNLNLAGHPTLDIPQFETVLQYPQVSLPMLKEILTRIHKTLLRNPDNGSRGLCLLLADGPTPRIKDTTGPTTERLMEAYVTVRRYITHVMNETRFINTEARGYAYTWLNETLAVLLGLSYNNPLLQAHTNLLRRAMVEMMLRGIQEAEKE